jgi:hypothetical protein
MVALDPTTRAAARRGAPGAGVVARPGADGARAGAGRTGVGRRVATTPSGRGGGDTARDHEEQAVGTVN